MKNEKTALVVIAAFLVYLLLKHRPVEVVTSTISYDVGAPMQQEDVDPFWLG